MRFYRTVVVFVLLLIACSKQPVGPDFSGEAKLAVFCVLNNETKTQQVKISRTLSFDETVSDDYVNANINDAEIVLHDQDSYSISKMPENRAITPGEPRTNDFFWSSWDYNYLINGFSATPGQTVELTIKAPDFGEVQAKTTIPDSFHITSLYGGAIRGDVQKNIYEPFDIHAEWTPSNGAYGYLVDLIIYKLDFQEFDTLYEDYQSDSDYLIEKRILLPDLVTSPNIKYEKIPILFKMPDGSSQRGRLTQETSIDVPFDAFMDHVNQILIGASVGHDGNFHLDYYRESLYYQVDVYAIDEALYNYTSVQYLKLGDERVIGQRTTIPDISNVDGGLGIVGAACCRHSPIVKYWWFDQLILRLSTYERLNHGMLPDGPELFEPEDNVAINLFDSLTFSWEKVDIEQFARPFSIVPDLPIDYVLYFQPRYMSFRPAQLACIVDTTFATIRPLDFLIRDCSISWYVKAVVVFEDIYKRHMQDRYQAPSMILNLPHWQLILAPEKSYDFFSGIYDVGTIEYRTDNSGVTFHTEPVSYLASMGSETRTLVIPSGHITGFENEKPHILSPTDNQLFESGDSLRWQPVAGADAYLLYFESKGGETFSAVSFTNRAAPPFHKYDFIEGLDDLEKFPSGSEWSWSVWRMELERLRPAVGIGDDGICRQPNEGPADGVAALRAPERDISAERMG